MRAGVSALRARIPHATEERSGRHHPGRDSSRSRSDRAMSVTPASSGRHPSRRHRPGQHRSGGHRRGRHRSRGHHRGRHPVPAGIVASPPAGANEFAAATTQSPPARTRRPGRVGRPMRLRVRNQEPRPARRQSSHRDPADTVRAGGLCAFPAANSFAPGGTRAHTPGADSHPTRGGTRTHTLGADSHATPGGTRADTPGADSRPHATARTRPHTSGAVAPTLRWGLAPRVWASLASELPPHAVRVRPEGAASPTSSYSACRSAKGRLKLSRTRCLRSSSRLREMGLVRVGDV
jgi:hypothetical protein